MLVVVVDVVQTAGLVSRYIHKVLEGEGDVEMDDDATLFSAA